MPVYHVTDGAKRTTLSLDQVMADYLALALGAVPRSPESVAQISLFLSDKIVSRLGEFKTRRGGSRPGYSAAALVAALDVIARPGLKDRYADWQIETFG